MKAVVVGKNSKSPFLIQIEDDLMIIEDFEPEGKAAGGSSPAEVLDKLEQMGQAIANVCQTIQHKVTEQLKEKRPNEFQLEFSVKLAGKAGIPMVTEGSVEGALKVVATWK